MSDKKTSPELIMVRGMIASTPPEMQATIEELDVLILSDERPAPNPVDAITQLQRERRHRLVPFQPNYGQPIVNGPKPDAAVLKALRKIQKRIRRGLPIGRAPR
jgi:hypothetical protein